MERRACPKRRSRRRPAGRSGTGSIERVTARAVDSACSRRRRGMYEAPIAADRTWLWSHRQLRQIVALIAERKRLLVTGIQGLYVAGDPRLPQRARRRVHRHRPSRFGRLTAGWREAGLPRLRTPVSLRIVVA